MTVEKLRSVAPAPNRFTGPEGSGRAGAFAAVARKLEAIPTEAHPWGSDAEAQRRVGTAIDRLRDEGVAVLHDRRVRTSRAGFDHLAVGPMGVYVVDTVPAPGQAVELRDFGGLRVRDVRLLVGGNEATELVRGAARRARFVERRVGERVTKDGGSIIPVLCLVDADWNRFARSFAFDGVEVVGPQTVAALITRNGPLTRPAVSTIAELLAAELPAR